MTARYRIIEKLYLRGVSEATGQLEQALVTLYATTLTYLAKAKRYFEENTALRILHSGLLAKSDLHDLLNKLESHEKEADRCTLLVEAEVNKDAAAQIADLSLEMKQISALREALVRIDRPILNMSHQLDRVEDHLDSMPISPVTEDR
jgi:regulator of replication initiation timing